MDIKCEAEWIIYIYVLKWNFGDASYMYISQTLKCVCVCVGGGGGSGPLSPPSRSATVVGCIDYYTDNLEYIIV